jgi:ribulose-phosphate 3-epimerase
MSAKVVASVLDADFACLRDEIAAIESAGVSRVHLDVMDGRFVPNITFGPGLVSTLRLMTQIELGVHLMTVEPERLVDKFIEAGADSVTFHSEATHHSHRLLTHIKSAGPRAGVAFNPSTPLSGLEYVIDETDLILIMTVNPGFGGQEFIDSMLPKIRCARAMIDESGRKIDLAVDGGLNQKTTPLVVEAGADYLVMGCSIFAHPDGPLAGARAALESVQGLAAGAR